MTRIVGIGVDICQVDRMSAALRRHPGLANKLFTPKELVNESGERLSDESLAARFAAKEALVKALGGLGGLRWHDCEVLSDESGKAHLVLSGTVAAAAEEAGVLDTHLSFSHDAGLAVAQVICEGQ